MHSGGRQKKLESVMNQTRNFKRHSQPAVRKLVRPILLLLIYLLRLVKCAPF